MSVGEDTLEGLKGVLVVVENMNPDVEEIGSYCDYNLRSLIESDVKQRLEMANIIVLTEDKNIKKSKIPYLYINISFFISSNGLYVYNIACNLTQCVFLEKDVPSTGSVINNFYYAGATWTSQGYIGLTEDWEDIRYHVKEQIDEFIRDYFLVNEEGLDEEELKKEQKKIEKDLKEMQKKGDKEPCHVQRLFYPDTGEYETRITALIDGEFRTITLSEEELKEM